MKTRFNFLKTWFFWIALILVAVLSYFAKNYFFEKNLLPENNPKISIIVPVYNTSKYLDECLISLTSQTLKEIEIVCVNDGSTDNSLEILNNYKNRDSRIKVIDQKNQGVCAARNAGIKAAQGEYITFVDSDDLVDINTYETCYHNIEKYNPDILGIGYYGFEDGHLNEVKKEPYNINDVIVYGDGKNTIGYPETKLDMWVDGCIWNKVIRRSFVIENNLFFKGKIAIGEDSLYNWLMFLRATKVVSDKNKFYYYRTNRSGSAINSATTKKIMDSNLSIAYYLVEDYNNFNYLKGHEKWLLDKILPSKNDFKSKSEEIDYASKLLSVIDEPFLKKINISDDRISELRKLAAQSK